MKVNIKYTNKKYVMDVSSLLKASAVHRNRYADFRHEFPGVVGDAVVNQGDFPGKSGDCHVMLRNVR